MDFKILPQLKLLEPELQKEIRKYATIKNFDKDAEILKEGQFVKIIPIVIDGLIKVFTRYDSKDLLLYYIQPQQSCIMSFSAGIEQQPSMVYALCEEPTKVLLLPVEKVTRWTQQYPNLNLLFFKQFNMRYCALLNTINHLLYDRLDVRLFDYLKEKSTLTGLKALKISHRQIANELGTAREVITRLLKKLEEEGKIKQLKGVIELCK